MRSIYYSYVLVAILGSLITSCANVGNLTGGPKDVTPPKLIPEKSTPFEKTHFYPDEIILTFDEWIQLKDAYNQILISPPLTKPVDYKVKGKMLHIQLHEEEKLQDSSTYVIQFGSAIQDITENNIANNLKFVFSTGDVIDSLEIKGKVTDAWTLKPVGGVNVMLYSEFEDSLPYKTKPNYVVRTDDKGVFVLQNLRQDSFKIFVLEDQNLNYLYDLDQERLAFQSSPIYVTDSTDKIPLVLFQKNIKNYVANSTIWSKVIRVEFDQTPKKVRYRFLDTLPSFQTWHGDSLYIWMDEIPDGDKELLIFDEMGMLDTVKIAVKKRKSKFTSALRIINDVQLQKMGERTWILHTNQPMELMKDKIVLLDSIPIPADSFVWVQDTNRELWRLEYAWNASLKYKLWLLPGSVQGYYGNTNSDTIKLDLAIDKHENKGNLTVHFNVKEAARTIVFILEKDQRTVAERTLQVRDSTAVLQFDQLPPGKYSARIIYDENGNGRWDSGSYLEGKQPELIQLESMQALRANWDLDVNILLKY